MTEYVAGFLFDTAGDYVTMVLKNRPEWQSGKLNGVGGKVDPGETASQAMAREFREEAGVYIPSAHWHNFLALSGSWGSVQFFRYFDGYLQSKVETMTDEEIETFRVRDVLSVGVTVPNMSWILPLAQYRNDVYETVTVKDKQYG